MNRSGQEPSLNFIGGNAGIGFDTAAKLAAASPNHHVIIGARTPSKGEKAVSDIQARNPSGTVSFIQLDVTSDDSIDAAVKHIETEFGRLDILVNNAGIAVLDKPLRQASRETFETNVIGPQVLTNKVAHSSRNPMIPALSTSALDLVVLDCDTILRIHFTMLQGTIIV